MNWKRFWIVAFLCRRWLIELKRKKCSNVHRCGASKIQVKFLRTVFICLILSTLSAVAAHTQAELLLSDDAAKPGETVLAGVHLKMESGWHTYWINPGEAGMTTKIDWQLPPGVTAGEIQWPLPTRIPPADVTTYGYENDVVLLVPLKLAADLKPGPLDLKAKVSWLECKEQCIPAGGSVEATLTVAGETKSSANEAMLKAWKEKVPKTEGPVAGLTYTNSAWWEKAATDDTRPVIIDRRSLEAPAASVTFGTVDFFPYAGSGSDIQPTVEKIAADASDIRLRLFVKKYSGDWPKEISGVIVTGSGEQRQGTLVHFSIADKGTSVGTGSTTASPSSGAGASSGPSLWKMLLYGFIGGLILNIMPCVLPVIALKILGFVGEARSHPGRVGKLGLVYTLGVLISFLALAGVVIGVKAAGHKAGWGMQFGNTHFLIALTILVVLVALNLFGVFEVTLGGRAMGAAGELASQHGVAGAFFNGVLATILATPCTAPFLSIALGFAFAQTTAIIVIVFLSIGVGLALPYLVLSFQPAWLKFLPKPGMWMEKFKMFMGFPMLATGIWLFTLVAGGTDKSTTLWFGLFLVVLALGAWIWGEFVQRGRSRRGLAVAVSLLLVGGFGAYAATRGADQIQWQPWTSAAVTKAQAEGHPVLVDFTADWCLTCQYNKKVAIEVPSVRTKLKQIGAVNLVGDYTHQPDNITDELNRYHRAGVPLVLVFPGKADAAPIVLPEVLTAGTVLNALDRATAKD